MGSIVCVVDLTIPIPVSGQVCLEICDLQRAQTTFSILYVGPLKLHHERFDTDEVTFPISERTVGCLGR